MVREVPNYIDISFTLLKRFEGKLPFDIYVKRSELNYTKIFNVEESIDWDRVDQYKKKDIKFFYVTKEQYQTYVKIADQLAKAYFGSKKTQNPAETAGFLKEMVNLSAVDILIRTNLQPETLEHAATMVMGCIDTLQKNPRALIKVVSLLSSHEFMVKHSLAVSVFSLILAKAVDVDSKHNLQNIGMGAFLHDIGTGLLPFDPENKEDMSADDRKESKTHTELGKRLLDEVPSLSSEIKMIVLQHHEQPNGAGYPNGLRVHDIYWPAKIVSIADTFASLTSRRSYREAYTPTQAIQMMEEDQGRFDKNMLATFAKMFTVPTEASSVKPTNSQ